MKTLYSSSFFSLIIGFFIFLGINQHPVEVVNQPVLPNFTNRIKLESDYFMFPSKPSIEIFDALHCPPCTDFIRNTLPLLKEKYVETKEANLTLYLTPNAADEGEMAAAIGAKCAGEQGKFWEMLDLLHDDPEHLTPKYVDIQAQVLELDILAFRECVKSEKYKNIVLEEALYAQKKGVEKFPATIMDNIMLLGNQPIENFDRVIYELEIERQLAAEQQPFSSEADLEPIEPKHLHFNSFY